MSQKTALIMAGGTGGHIFPGLALAQALRQTGWRVHWLGTPGSMESQLVPAQNFAFETIDFSGVRGKGLGTLVRLPWRLLKAMHQSWRVLQRVRPDVVVGFGGYVTLPAGLMTALRRLPLVLHEQNSIAGMANRVLSKFATRMYTAFPDAVTQGAWCGNPLRADFLHQQSPSERFSARRGALNILVLGGSLGAKALNDVVPKAVALLPIDQRPVITHQSGAKQIEALKANYAAANVQATLTPFIDDTASAMAQADLVICRAGASTVTELAAVGAAALFVPFPHAVDDHQTTNARFLADKQAAWLIPQSELTPEKLAQLLQKTERSLLLDTAQRAYELKKTEAVTVMVRACEELVA